MKKYESNFIEITLRHDCFHVNLLHFFRIFFLKNNSGGLLLNKVFVSCFTDLVISYLAAYHRNNDLILRFL